MFWEIFVACVVLYAIVGIVLLKTLTIDEYRRQKTLHPEKPDEQVRSEAEMQGWANSVIFWPFYLMMHLSSKALDKESHTDIIRERGKQILEEAVHPEKKWDKDYGQAQKEAHEKRFLEGKGP